MKQPFLMRCSHMDFESVKPILNRKEYGFDYSGVKFESEYHFVYFDGSFSFKVLTDAETNELIKNEVILVYSKFNWEIFNANVKNPEYRSQDPSSELIIAADQINETRYNPKTFEGFAAKFFGATDPITSDKDSVSPNSMPLKKENPLNCYISVEGKCYEDIPTDFHFSYFPKAESPISSGINISAGNVALAYMEFKKIHPSIEPFCIHDKSQL